MPKIPNDWGSQNNHIEVNGMTDLLKERSCIDIPKKEPGKYISFMVLSSIT